MRGRLLNLQSMYPHHEPFTDNIRCLYRGRLIYTHINKIMQRTGIAVRASTRPSKLQLQTHCLQSCISAVVFSLYAFEYISALQSATLNSKGLETRCIQSAYQKIPQTSTPLLPRRRQPSLSPLQGSSISISESASNASKPIFRRILANRRLYLKVDLSKLDLEGG